MPSETQPFAYLLALARTTSAQLHLLKNQDSSLEFPSQISVIMTACSSQSGRSQFGVFCLPEEGELREAKCSHVTLPPNGEIIRQHLALGEKLGSVI